MAYGIGTAEHTGLRTRKQREEKTDIQVSYAPKPKQWPNVPAARKSSLTIGCAAQAQAQWAKSEAKVKAALTRATRPGRAGINIKVAQGNDARSP
jgi:hypothetical protein